MAKGTSISAEAVITESTLGDIWRRATESTGDAVFDWRPLRRVDRFAGALLSNALLTELAHRQITVYMPQRTYRWGMLARASLLFGLAQRDPRLTKLETQDENLIGFLDPWRRTWSPAVAVPRYRLAGKRIAAESNQTTFPSLHGLREHPSVYGRYHAAFVNVHRSQKSGVQSSRDRVRAWLMALLPGTRAKPPQNDPLLRFVEIADVLLTELLENVNEHAPFREAAGKRIPSKSLVQLSVTLGGGSESYNRLYIGVQDTGPGLISTARPKLGSEAPHDDEDLLEKLFRGGLRKIAPRRGHGLPAVHDIIKDTPGAELRVATGSLALEATRSNGLAVTAAGVPVPGSTFVMKIPLPRKAQARGGRD